MVHVGDIWRRYGEVWEGVGRCRERWGDVRRCEEVLRTCFATYEGVVLAILLYGSESWCLTEVLQQLLRAFHGRCLRSTCAASHARAHVAPAHHI